MEPYRAGIVALIGRPNVGKSTLLNSVVGQKISIVSDKAQTTRKRLLGIATTDRYQIVFADTPGVHEAHTHLGKILNEAAQGALADVDAVLVVVDSSKEPNKDDEAIAQMLAQSGWLPPKPGKPVLLCLNKMDLLKAHFVQSNVEAYCKLYQTEDYMLTCLTKEQNLQQLVDLVVRQLPEGPPLYAEDELTDQPMRSLAAELIREKALRLTRQEVPHALACLVESWDEVPETDLVRIHASLIVEKEGQKAILIGKRGAMLKRIGTEARAEIEALIGHRVYLELFVKVRPEWRQNPRMLQELEYLP